MKHFKIIIILLLNSICYGQLISIMKYEGYDCRKDSTWSGGCENKYIHMVEPVPLGGELGYYSGEDMPEKTSMMAYSDVFTTVYSTMVVEAAIHNRPIVSICIDVSGGWNDPDKYSLSLMEIGEWPTHLRFRNAQAGEVAFDQEALRIALNRALNQDGFQEENRKQFVENEITFTDASSGIHVADFLFSKIDKHFVKGE